MENSQMLKVGGRSIESPFSDTASNTERGIFIAGGISGCPEWQNEAVSKILTETIHFSIKPLLFNPRRRNFSMDDPTVSIDQIVWENYYLRTSDAILFWFPKETLCPITLFELGAWSSSRKPLFVGTDVEYKRRHDVVIQMGLARPEVVIRLSLDGVVNDCINFLREESFYADKGKHYKF
jgi:hypothetical protein